LNSIEDRNGSIGRAGSTLVAKNYALNNYL
jgi:hypothetical protein